MTCDSLGELKDALHKVASEEATDDSYTRDLEVRLSNYTVDIPRKGSYFAK